MKKYYKLIIAFLFTIFSNSIFAQEANEMADMMRSNGKIYVVVGVISIIFIGIIIYLIRLDLKISKIEKKQKINNQ
jgi:hypothetical protein